MKFLKIITLGLIILLGITISYFVISSEPENLPTQKEIPDSTNTELIKWINGDLFDVFVNPKDVVFIDGKKQALKGTYQLKPELTDIYSEIGVYNEKNKPLFIIPLYTASAYSQHGFYDFYKGQCDSCITTKIVSINELIDTSSANAVKVLKLLGYDSITDVELDKNPNILLKYNKIIILHNEYVTKKMFDAITNHPNVIYLYPNALYAEITVNYVDNTITLIRGHDYPQGIANGFDWEFDNTPLEQDKKCDNWKFYDIPNGKMLNCYPEQKIWKDKELLRVLKEL